MAEYSVMDRINMILSDPDHATMTLAQIVTEEIREFKASEQYANMIQAEAYYRNRTDVQRKTNDVANRSNTRIEHPILKKLVDQKANYLLGKPFTVDTKNSSYGDALNDVFDQTFRRKIKSLGKGAVKSGIAWLQPYFDDGKLAFMRIPSAELVPIWRDAERTKLDAFIRFYDQVIYIGTRKHTITHAELWWTGGVKYFKTDAFAGTIAGDFIVDTDDNGNISFYINNGNIPELRVSSSFSELMETYRNNKDTMSRREKEALLYAKQKVERALGYIEAIKQRYRTLTLTMQAIIDWQRKFFQDGDEADLKPMILKNIADRTGLDISTISRVSNVKYAQTNWGTFPLRFFFSDGYTTDDGEEMSTRKIKLALKDLVSKENKTKPLSDDALRAALAKLGYPIARRTVAKYREQLGIPVARLRKN